MPRSLAGTRIRARRRSLGLQQTLLAKAAGISPSYLNLIEHNRRVPGGRVLAALARELGLPTRALEEGAETELIEELRQTAALNRSQKPEANSVDEFIGRFPGWARMAAAQARQLRDQAETIATLTERRNYDPHLQETLHEMLTTITAIRSTSGILATEDDIEAAQAARFQSVIHRQSRRLSDAAQELVSYFDSSEEDFKASATEQETLEAFLVTRDYVFAELEGTDDYRSEPMEKAIETILKAELPNASREALIRGRAHMMRYALDAAAMPLAPVLDVAQKSGFSPDALVKAFGVDLHAAFRRLATLKREDITAPEFGLLIINAAGQPIYRKALEEFSLPRSASGCALWPAFRALSSPGMPIHEIIVMPNGREFLARAIALPLAAPSFGEAPGFSSAMIITSLNDAHKFGMMLETALQPRAVGTSCRLCQRTDCLSRAQPSILPTV